MVKSLAIAAWILGVTLAAGAFAGDHDGDVLAEGHSTNKLPAYDAADASAPEVSAANAFASERFWPYYVSLTRPVESLVAGTQGVLIRLEADGRARVDFGRDGLRELPIEVTDFVARANAIRLGKTDKQAPNFLFAIAPRLLDSRVPVARAYPFDDAFEKKLFLCVFADPWHKDFPKLVRDLTPLAQRPGVLAILFPLSHRGDVQVSGQLRAMKWPVPFLYAHLAEPYAHTLLEKETALPAVSLETPDGRVLYESHFSGDVVAKLAAALDATSASGE